MNPNNTQLNHQKMLDAIELVERFLPLSNWNFKQSAQFFENTIYPINIYDCAKCRIKAFYEAPSGHQNHRMNLYYGRLDVPNNAQGLSWRYRENYHLYWHSVRFPLQFLDGLSPRESINEKEPRLIREFEQSEIAKRIQYEPERILVMHAVIWEACGQQLFDIFDIRNTSLWKKYSIFVREFWETLSRP